MTRGRTLRRRVVEWDLTSESHPPGLPSTPFSGTDHGTPTREVRGTDTVPETPETSTRRVDGRSTGLDAHTDGHSLSPLNPEVWTLVRPPILTLGALVEERHSKDPHRYSRSPCGRLPGEKGRPTTALSPTDTGSGSDTTLEVGGCRGCRDGRRRGWGLGREDGRCGRNPSSGPPPPRLDQCPRRSRYSGVVGGSIPPEPPTHPHRGAPRRTGGPRHFERPVVIRENVL